MTFQACSAQAAEGHSRGLAHHAVHSPSFRPYRTRRTLEELHTESLMTLRKVLIVDDHDELGESLARVVRALGHEVALAKDGPSALVLAERFQPDCALLDLSLPGMNGMELGRQLRKTFPRERLCMIALTGFTGSDLREGCLAAGFDEQLTKPGDINRLAQLLGGDSLDTDSRARQ